MSHMQASDAQNASGAGTCNVVLSGVPRLREEDCRLTGQLGDDGTVTVDLTPVVALLTPSHGAYH